MILFLLFQPTPTPTDQCKHEGNNPDPDDCTKYYLCVNMGSYWQSTEQTCTSGTVFNPDAGICDWPENVPECSA